MDQRGDEIHTSTTEASGGSREGVVRWVLIIGLVLVIGLFAIIVMTGVLSQDEGDDSHQNVQRQMQHDQAVETSRGEPLPPTFGDSEGSASSASTGASATATPGDAPAGDPKPNAQ